MLQERFLFETKIIPWMFECHGWSDAPYSSERSNNYFATLDSKCDSKIQWQGTLDYLLCRGRVRKSCHGDPRVELGDSEKTPLHSDPLLRGNLDAAGPRLSPRLGQ